MKYKGLILSAVILASCSHDGYNSGDGKYSYFTADFVEAHVNSDLLMNYAITDNNDSLVMSTPLSNQNFTVKDTVYRGVLYYNKQTLDDGSLSISPLTYANISVLDATQYSDTLKYDPMDFESLWKSKSGKYITLSLILMTGTDSGTDNKQTLNIIRNGTTSVDGGHKCLNLVVCHNQNSVPEYYSSRCYVSLNMSKFSNELESGDSISLSVKTSDGWIRKSLAY